jgi:hypothetical protein
MSLILEEAPMTAFQAAGGNARTCTINKGLSPRSSLRATAQSIELLVLLVVEMLQWGPTRSQDLRGGGSRQVSYKDRQDVINRGTVAAAKPASPKCKTSNSISAGVPTGVGAGNAGASVQPAPRPDATAAPKPTATAAPRPTATAAAPKPAAAPAAKPAGSAMDQFAKANPKLAAASAERDRTRGTSATTNPLMKDMKSRLPAPKTPSPTTAKTGFDLAKKGVNLAAGFDMFDVVKGYLIGEGYADTEEAALAIMINMSEEWRQSIIKSI